jgi:uncharacterized metal-binding protein
MRKNNSNTPIIYSCSGCSSAAQMANYIALQLDKLGIAEMSCIAGVGGDVPHLVKIAKSGRLIIALDGCPLACAKNCLARHGIPLDIYHQLSKHGVKKNYHADFDRVQADPITMCIIIDIKKRSHL